MMISISEAHLEPSRIDEMQWSMSLAALYEGIPNDMTLCMAGDNLIRKIEGGVGHGIHIVITVLSQATDRMEVRQVLDALKIALIELAVLGSRMA